jgi:hypothetical protein
MDKRIEDDISETVNWKEILVKQKNMLDAYGYEDFKRTLNIHWAMNFHPLNFIGDVDEEVIAMWNLLYEKYPSEILDLFSEPLEGNPLVVKYRGRVVSYDLAMSLCEYFSIAERVDFNSIKTITEIGAGYGRMAFIVKKLHPHITYRLVDFRQTLDLQKRYLEKVIGLDGLEFIEANEIHGKSDLIIAVDCLNEFQDEEINKYFEFIENNTNYFYVSSPKNSLEVPKSMEKLFSREHLLRADYFEELCKCQIQQ